MGGCLGGILKVNMIRLLVVATLGEYQPRPVCKCVLGGEADWDWWCDTGSPPGPSSMFSAAKKNALAPRATSASSSLSSWNVPPPPRQALSRQHLCLNDFNELNQFLGCLCCCFQYLCCCCHYFLVLSGV